MAASMAIYMRPTVNRPAAAATPIRMLNCTCRALRRSSRQGSRLMRGILVEAPQGEAAGHQQRRGLGGGQLGLGARTDLHLSEGIAYHRRHAHLLSDAFGGTRDAGAAAADDDLVEVRIFAGGDRKNCSERFTVWAMSSVKGSRISTL